VREGEFKCHECLGSVEFLPPPTGKSVSEACGCDFVSYVTRAVPADPDSSFCQTCPNAIDNCNVCDDLGTSCEQCATPYFESGDGLCVLEPCR
jgi:hypothetical protein